MAIDFTEKLGPLPVWGWGLIGGGVVVGAYYLLNRGGDSDGAVTYLDDKGYQTAGITGGSASIDETKGFDNNTLWLTRASAGTAAALTKSPTTVYTALKKWLYGETITRDEKEIVDTAVRLHGMPPEGTQGNSGVTGNPPTTVTVKSPVAATPYTAVRESSVYTTLAGVKTVQKIAKGGKVNVVVGGSPTRFRILLANGTFGYVPRSNFRKG